MYLSRIPINLSHRETVRAVSVPEYLHAAIEDCFEGQRQRNLWRIDNINGRSFLLIVSRQKVNFSPVFEKFGGEGSWETLQYEPLLKTLAEGQKWYFRLRANPTKSLFDSKNPEKRGKVVAVRPGQEKQWLESRGLDNGFSADPNEFEMVEQVWKRFTKGKNTNRRGVVIYTVVYEGVLTITDPQRFSTALSNGIGRGKAYGCGMLTIAGRNS